MSSLIDPTTSRFKPGVVLLMEVVLTNSSRRPKLFEYCAVNNMKGVHIQLDAPDGGWRIGSNTIVQQIASSFYKADIAPWHNMHRLELYGNERSAYTTDTITFNNVRFDYHGVRTTYLLR